VAAVSKTLIIAEKKSVAQDVAKAFGGTFASAKTQLESDEYVITWAVGHLAELAEPEAYDKRFEKWRLSDLPIIPEHFEVVPRAEGSGKDQLAAIRKLVKRKDVDRIVNACDAGREGELIFAYVLDVAGRPDVPVERAWFSSMTRKAIRDAFTQLRPGGEMQPLEQAARSRSEADWMVGMNATRAATVKARSLAGGKPVSLGRVQTPTLAILVRREKEIEAFTPTPYWLVDAVFETDAGASYKGRWFQGSADQLVAGGEGRLASGDDAAAIVDRVRGCDGRVAELRKREQRQQPPLLYDLTALQREAASWYGFTARRTLSAAQGCYEKAVLTYPRTSSRYLSTDMIPELQEIAGHVGRRAPEYAQAADFVQRLGELPLGRVVDDSKVTDHHAIIPTNAAHEAELGDDERRIYDMVARRFLAVFHSAAVFENTTVVTEVEGERFRSRGKVMLEPGWRAAYAQFPVDPAQTKAQGEGSDEEEQQDQDLPQLRDGEDVRCSQVEAEALETKPPPRYGEAALLAAMEGAGKLVTDDELRDAMKDSGIGTPATRAAHIERLISVGYVVRDGRRLMPTQKGIQVVDLLDQHELTSPELTGRWEHRLLEMERGAVTREAFMHDIADFTRRTVEFLAELPPEKTRFQRRNLGIVCPRCGKGELIENQRGFGCSTWSREDPGCGFIVWKTISGKTITEDVLRELIENGRTKELPGFRSKAGKSFRAMLVLDPQAERPVTFEFKPRPGQAANGKQDGANEAGGESEPAEIAG
jgi:DNA topoisomerase-3